jgi:large subunit ribosomal protein L10
MNKREKEALVADLHGRLENAEGTFLVHYRGLNVEAMNALRNELRRVDTEFRVVKNRLLRLASRGTGAGSLQERMEGPSAIAIAYEDVIGPAKVLVDFAKKNDKLAIQEGQVSGKPVSLEGIKRLAELPGRDLLLAQTLSAMQAVPASLVRVLGGVLGTFMNVMKAIEQKKTE